MASRYSNIGRRKTGLVIRPIERIVTSEDRVTAQLFAMSTGGKFTKGPERQQNQLFGGATAGRTIRSPLGGGVYNPAVVDGSFTSPQVAGPPSSPM